MCKQLINVVDIDVQFFVVHPSRIPKNEPVLGYCFDKKLKKKKSFTKDPNFNKALFDQLLIKLWERLQILSLEILQIWDLGKFVSNF